MNISNVEEMNAVLSILKNIPTKTRKDLIAVLNQWTLKSTIFTALPMNDSN
jgi:hypothetical protein